MGQVDVYTFNYGTGRGSLSRRKQIWSRKLDLRLWGDFEKTLKLHSFPFILPVARAPSVLRVEKPLTGYVPGANLELLCSLCGPTTNPKSQHAPINFLCLSLSQPSQLAQDPRKEMASPACRAISAGQMYLLVSSEVIVLTCMFTFGKYRTGDHGECWKVMIQREKA